MNTILALIGLWFARKAEGRMKIITDEENFREGREKRQAEAYYKRKPFGEVTIRPESIEQIEEAISREKRQLEQTNERIERNRQFFRKQSGVR